MVTVTEKTPRMRFDETLIRKSLSPPELEEVSYDGEIDWHDVLSKHGTQFISDEPHVEITSNTGITAVFWTTDLLKYFSGSLVMEACAEADDDVPFWEFMIFGRYVVLTVICGGPDGGAIVIDAQNTPEVVAATTEATSFRAEDVVFAERYQAFICSGYGVEFNELEADVTVITVAGNVYHSNIGVIGTEYKTGVHQILSFYEGASGINADAQISYISHEDLLVFRIRDDYRNMPLLVSCKTSTLFTALGIPI